jgi:hypothetical protein
MGRTCRTTSTLRDAASYLRQFHGKRSGRLPWEPALADLLDENAANAQATFEIIQSPSGGIDQPPAIAYGDPERAEEIVAMHHATILRVARGLLGDVAVNEIKTTEGLL